MSDAVPQPYRICYITYGGMYDTILDVLKTIELSDTKVEVIRSTPDTLAQATELAGQHGAEVYICRSSNAAEFSTHVIGHMVEVPISDLDYLRAVKEAGSLGTRIALLIFRKVTNVPDVAAYRYLLGLPVDLILYEDVVDLREKLQDTAHDVFIGTEAVQSAAQELGVPFVLVRSSRESITRAILNARAKALALRQERTRQAISRSIINMTAFGIIICNEEGLVTSCNQTAADFTGVPREAALNQPFSEVAPWLAADPTDLAAPQTDFYKVRNGTLLHCYQRTIRSHVARGGLVTILIPSGRKRESVPPQKPAAPLMRFQDLVSGSPVMRALAVEAAKLTDLTNPVMLIGESGTGRSQLAECLHSASTRKNEPFVRLDLGSIPEGSGSLFLLGAGGEHQIDGQLASVGNGTVLLENLRFASPALLESICHILRSGRIRAFGEPDGKPVRFRVITSLTQEELDTLSPGVLHCLGVFRLRVPLLRERREDLAELFVQQRLRYSERQRQLDRLTPQMTHLIETYDWPGNLHELRAVVQRYTIALRNEIRPSDAARYLLLRNAIGEAELLACIKRAHPTLKQPAQAEPAALRAAIEEIKKLLKYNNDQVAAALGMSRTTLWRSQKTQAEKPGNPAK